MRARAHVEELRGGKTAIIVNELPYGVKKGGDVGVIKKIADLVNEKTLPEVSDVKDLSDKTGMRIQIELKRDAIAQVVLNKLFKHTSLQTTFGYNAVALVDGVPRTLSLLELVRHYLDYQREIVTRRSQVRPAQGDGAGPHPRGLPDRPRQPRRDHRAHPRVRRRERRARDVDGALRAQRGTGPGDPRPPAPRADRARAQGDRVRVRRQAGAHRRAPRHPRRPRARRRAPPRGAARDQAELRARRRPSHRDRRGRGGARARGSDRRGGHGHRDHALRLHQAAAARRRIASSVAAASA